MGPMDHSSFGVVDIFSYESHIVAAAQAGEPLGKIDIVGNENGFAVGKFKDEALMTVAFVIVGKNFHHRAYTFCPDMGKMFSLSFFHRYVTRFWLYDGSMIGLEIRMVGPGIQQCQQCDRESTGEGFVEFHLPLPNV